jgi:hypothetical protein
VVNDFKLTLGNGEPVPEQLKGSAELGLTFCLSFVPNTELETYGDRDVHAPDGWRVMTILTDDDGNQVLLPESTGEFYSYEYMGNFRKDPLTPKEHVLWFSPDAPETMEQGTQYRWCRAPLPEEEGICHLEVVVYPTADPYMLGEEPEWGEGLTIFEAEVEVFPGMSPLHMGYDGEVRRVTPFERRIFTERFRSRM